MAVYHATIRYLSRSNRNTVKAVAYRTGTDLYDERTGQWFYHADKTEVGHVELLLPHDAPLWAKELKDLIAHDRKGGIQQLSHVAERAEKRKDSCVYREFEFALPKELTKEQNIKLANEFLQDQVCGRGVMVLASFHWDRDEETGEERPHCHALFMTRGLEEKGFSKKKETLIEKKAFLMTLREQLAAYTNFHLQLHGHDRRVDHRSYAEQGIDIEPQTKLARNVKTMEDRTGFFEHKNLERRALFEAQRQRNVARLIKRPETVFDIVTSQQSTFMWGDVEKVLARYVKEEEIFNSLNAKLKASSALVLLREEKRMTMEGTVQTASIYTTQKMMQAELSLVHLAEKLASRSSHGTRKEEVEASIQRAHEELSQQGSQLSSDQVEALHHVTKADQLSCLVGYAGAGKSTAFKTAKDVWEASGYRVYGLAPTGRAAQNLEDIGLSSQTIHKFLKDYHEGRSQYRSHSVLVLDEAGMVDVRRFNELLQAVNHLGVKLVISGDGAQAQPIEAGPGFRLITDRLDVQKIETVIRQKIPWQREATRLFGTYQTQEALEMYLNQGHVHFVDEKVPDLETLVAQRRHREVVGLYNLSRRVCGNIWYHMSEELQSSGVSREDFLKTVLSHHDHSLFKRWQEIRRSCAAHMSENMATYRSLMKEKGVDPIAFATQFVDKGLSAEDRQQEMRHLIKVWKLERLDPHQPLHMCEGRTDTRKALGEAWQKSITAHPDQSHLIVTYTKRETHLLNEEARHRMRLQGNLAVEEYFHLVKRESKDDFGQPLVREESKTFAKGERIVFTRNDRGLNVKNGTLGTLEEIDAQKLKVRIDGEDRVVSFASTLYPYFDRGWAITIIKSQGSTADRVFKLATFEEDRNLAYVGMTRHRESLQVFGSKLDFWREEIFRDRLSQNREKLSSLDYITQEEAQSRLKPPARLMNALSSLGNRLESLGYYSRKGWESACERFLGKTRPEDRILLAQDSLTEVVRAREMGINATLSSGRGEEQLAQVLRMPEAKSLSNERPRYTDNPESMLSQLFTEASPPAETQSQNAGQVHAKMASSLENTKTSEKIGLEEAYSRERIEMLDQPAHKPESVLSELSHNMSYDIKHTESSTSGQEKAPLLPEDMSAFIEEQAAIDTSRKAHSDLNIRYKSASSQSPYYSVAEVRQSLTPYSVENLCHRLLGNPHRHLSNKLHLRYGNSGALAISLSSKSLGLWKDHSRDEEGDIFKLVQRERGGDFKQALAWVAEALSVSPERSQYESSYTSLSLEKEENARRLQKVNKLFTSSKPVQGTLGERYLREHRNIQGELSPDIRFIPQAWNNEAKYYIPALAAFARDQENTVKAVQLIYLDKRSANKADVSLQKQSFGMIKGSYVLIQRGEGAVFVAEGLETTLSIKEAGIKGSLYASLGVTNFKNASTLLKDKTQLLVLCADEDGKGSPSHKAVDKAVQSLKQEGVSVSVIRPDAAYDKADFNDVLKREGIKGIQTSFKDYLNVDPKSFEELASLERYRQHMPEEREQMQQDRLKNEETTPLQSPACIDNQALLRNSRELYSSPSSIEAEPHMAGLPSADKPELQKNQEINFSREETLRLQNDVEKFIQMRERASETRALVSGESKGLYKEMNVMIESWKEDGRFERAIQETGNRRAIQYIEQYHHQQKHIQERSQGIAFEM